jgi:phosphohistidine phosphatase SixA
LLLLPTLLAAQTLFVVRHAERTGDPDPPLNAQGRTRAKRLATVLGDTGVTRIFVSDTLRARQTAEPLALRTGVKISIVPQAQPQELLRMVREAASPGAVILVVGHRATVPEIVGTFSGQAPKPLASGEHDRLHVVTLSPSGATGATSLLLRY